MYAGSLLSYRPTPDAIGCNTPHYSALALIVACDLAALPFRWE